MQPAKELPKEKPQKIVEAVTKTLAEEEQHKAEASEVAVVKPTVFVERFAERLEQEIVAEQAKENQPIVVEPDVVLASSEPLHSEQLVNNANQPGITVLAAPETPEIVFEEDKQSAVFLPDLFEADFELIENEAEQATAEYIEPDEFGLPEPESADEIVEDTPVWAEELEVPGHGLEIQAALPETATSLVELLPIEPVELAEKLQTLPMERLEEVAAILEAVINIAQSFEGLETMEPEQAKVQLTQMVERLLTCLEIEHHEMYINAFVEAILSGDLELDFDMQLAAQDEGTHERKYTSAWIMAALNQQLYAKEQNHSFIGRCVMRLSLLDAQPSWAA